MIVALPKAKMNASEYLRWSQAQDDGRFELVGGEVVMMSPETVRHVQIKNEAWLALRNAISKAGIGCTAYGDGAGVKINETTVREPDVSVQCAPADPDSLLLDQPIVVVEVVSPSSSRSDTGAKVAEYFRVPSILHYLIIDPASRAVIQHSRTVGSSSIVTNIHRSGSITLDPPGLEVRVEDLLAKDSRSEEEV